MNKFNKAAAAVITGATMAGSAFAELPAGVATGIAGASADGVTIVGLLAAAGAAVYLIAKVLGRFGLKL